MALDFSPLINAVNRLDEGFTRYSQDISDAQLRDGLIQRFEFTYDIAHKMLRRVMELGAANPEEIDRMGFPDLIRSAYEQCLITSTWSEWRLWREMRNITSHSYDEAKAVQVVAEIPAFLHEMQMLAASLPLHKAQ